MLLDTHAAVFLHAGRLEEFTTTGRRFLEREELFLSPMSALEMQYLFEVGRIRFPAEPILADLSTEIGLSVLDRDWYAVVRKSWEVGWARDPFDRMISAQAILEGQRLLTRDRTLLEHCSLAFW